MALHIPSMRTKLEWSFTQWEISKETQTCEDDKAMGAHRIWVSGEDL